MNATASPISLAGSELGVVRHICAFFTSDDEEYRVLLPFIKKGLEHGDKAVHVVNPEARQGHLRRLAGVGIVMRTHPLVIIGGISSKTRFLHVPRSFSQNFASGGRDEQNPNRDGPICTS
jgi:hypothetical protein